MRPRTGIAAFATLMTTAGVLAAAAAGATAAHASTTAANGSRSAGVFPGQTRLIPGDLLVSTSDYKNDPNIVAGTTQLPPGCTGANCATAIANGNYPYVFNNDSVDGSFGVTSPLYLKQITPSGQPQGVIPVPTSELTTSFSSKSEGALNLSSDGRSLTFMDYVAAPDTVDASNANTPGVIDPTNPVPGAYYRAVAQLSANGKFTFTETNAYSGNNGRAAVEATVDGKDYYYTAGNAGNGSNPQPTGVILGAGTQIITPSDQPEAKQTPGQPTPVGSFNVTQLGGKADKVGKDDNFRGLALYNNVLYYTKGSGSNGVNTVYFLDTTGTACPDGVGLPAAGAKLPTAGIESTLTSTGLASNMCILKGFPTALAKNATDASDYPFGLWFANPTTLYVADEGAGDNTYANGQLHGGGRVRHGRPAEVGLQLHRGPVAARLHPAERPQPRRPVHRPRLPDRDQLGHRAAVGAGHRRPAQPDRPGQPRRDRVHLGGHLHRERRRRRGRGPEPAGRDHRLAQGDHRASAGAVPHRRAGSVRPGRARRVVHAGHGRLQRSLIPVRQLHKR